MVRSISTGVPRDGGGLVAAELVLPAEPFDAVLGALCLHRPPLEDGVAEAFSALGDEDEGASGEDRLPRVLHRLLGLEEV